MAKVKWQRKKNSYLLYAFNKFLLNVESLVRTTGSGLVSSQGSSRRSIKQPLFGKVRSPPPASVRSQAAGAQRSRQGAQALRSTARLGAEPTAGRALGQLPASGGAYSRRAQPSWRPKRRTL